MKTIINIQENFDCGNLSIKQFNFFLANFQITIKNIILDTFSKNENLDLQFRQNIFFFNIRYAFFYFGYKIFFLKNAYFSIKKIWLRFNLK